MEQVFILIVVGLFALLNKMLKQGEKGPPTPPRRMMTRPPVSPQSRPEQDSMKSLLEALGLPSEHPPSKAMPPLVPRRATASRKPAPAPRQQPVRPVSAPPVVAPIPAATAAPVPAVAEPVDAAANIRLLLKSPDSIRSAIILREILGPPRCMQQF